jgi:threonine synthase
VTLYLKLETRNPTGSFKDRGSAFVAAAALAAGAPRLVVASTGNAAASTAAYAARCGLALRVVVPSWCEPAKLWNTACHGAEVRVVDGGFAEAEAEYRAHVDRGWYPAGTDNPARREGTKTLVYELFEQLGRERVDRLIVPIGTGGLIAAVHEGLTDLVVAGVIDALPRIDGVQVDGAPPLDQDAPPAPGPSRPSVATGINIPRPFLAAAAHRAIVASGGRRLTVTDAEILAAQRRLATLEGVTAEPTGAVAAAAAWQSLAAGRIDAGEVVVALVTGSLKSAEQISAACGSAS